MYLNYCRLIKVGLEAFRAPLDRKVEDFEQQLDEVRQKIVAKAEGVNEKYRAYLKLRDVDHKFVL